jgi:hypothetical protein
MDDDFPAAHSMDTQWFAVDADGHVASFDSGTMGAVAEGATQEMGYEITERIQALLPLVPVVFDLDGGCDPGRVYDEPHMPQREYRGWNPLCFLKTLDPVRGEIAAGRAFEVPAVRGFGVVFREFNDELMRRLHEGGVCLGCRRYEFDRDNLRPDSPDMFFLAARYGLYYYGHLWDDTVAGPYGREELPLYPVHLDMLPPDLRRRVGRVRFDGLCFAQTQHIQPAEWLRCDFFEPEAGWIASDGVTRRRASYGPHQR